MNISTRRRGFEHRYYLFLRRLKRLLSQPLNQAGQRKLEHYLQCVQRYSRRLAAPGLAGLCLGLSVSQTQAQGPIGSEFLVNSFTGFNQFEQAIEMDDLGNTVVVYSTLSLDGDGYGVYMKRYDHLGNQVLGETRVNTRTTDDQRAPAIAMDVDGDFVVVWQSENQVGATSGWDIYGQRFNASGVAQGVEFKVNTFTTGTQGIASTSMDEAGNFVVIWSSKDQEGAGSDYGIYGQRYNAMGTAQGTEFRVNQFTTEDQHVADVAMDGDGDFVVVWQSENQEGPGSGFGIFARRYNASGSALAGEFQVNSFTTLAQRQPSVARENNGDFAIVWHSQNEDASGTGVIARRYTAAGVALGEGFQVNTYTTSSQANPDVAMDADGDFAVVWQSYGQDGDKDGIYGQRYDWNGQLRGGEFQVHSFTIAGQSFPVVAMDGDGDFAVSWFSYNQEGPASGYGVYAQRFCPGTGAEFQVNSFTVDDQNGPSVAMDTDMDFVVVWQSKGQDGSLEGIYGQRYLVDGASQGGEFLINTETTNNQSIPSVAMDADGDFVVVWQSFEQDGSSFGIYGQRYQANGTPQGGEFRVNAHTTDNQSFPSVAMDMDGDFVVVWQSFEQDGSLTGIYGRRYEANGAPQGGEFRVNTHTTDNQRIPTVAMDADGDFVVVWHSFGQDGSSDGIYGQRYQANGATLGGEFPVNTGTFSVQRAPSIARERDGDFVVVWESNGQDGSGYGIYGQRYQANGTPQGGEFRINMHTTNSQRSPKVTIDLDGDFVVVWHSDGQDGSVSGIYGQRYLADGTPQGGEFRANTHTSMSQASPSVAANPDGDLVVVWRSFGQDGDSGGIYAQRYRGKMYPCQSMALELSGTITGFAKDQTQGTIMSNQVLLSTAQGTYQSAETVVLNQGFQVDAGAVFQALIDDCGL